MRAVTLGVVIGRVVLGLLSVSLRRRGAAPAHSPGPVDGSALGEVPGYMPGMRRRIEPHDETAAELVLPTEERGIDLDAGEVRIRRSR